MNQTELIELSKAAAKVVGIAAYTIIKKDAEGQATDGVWLHEDNARCFELMCRYEIEIPITSTDTGIFIGGECLRNYDDREQTTRVVILKAIVAIGEQK